MCNNNKLEDFVANAANRGRITFGDVRRLRRDYLPNGVTSRQEAEVLIGLDGKVGRIDRAWTDWLATIITDFALLNEGPMDETGITARDWVKALLAASGTSTKATRRITREIRCEAEPVTPPIAVPAKKPMKKVRAVAQTVVSEAASDANDVPRLAAYVTFDCRNLAGSFARTVPQPYFHPIL